jgi:hypothetical protein
MRSCCMSSRCLGEKNLREKYTYVDELGDRPYK